MSLVGRVGDAADDLAIVVVVVELWLAHRSGGKEMVVPDGRTISIIPIFGVHADMTCER